MTSKTPRLRHTPASSYRGLTPADAKWIQNFNRWYAYSSRPREWQGLPSVDSEMMSANDSENYRARGDAYSRGWVVAGDEGAALLESIPAEADCSEYEYEIKAKD